MFDEFVFFFIFNRVNSYNNTNNFQNIRIKNVVFSSFSIELILTVIQTIYASFKRIGSKCGLSRVNLKKKKK